jgi:hypothetical protein
MKQILYGKLSAQNNRKTRHQWAKRDNAPRITMETEDDCDQINALLVDRGFDDVRDLQDR